MTEKQFSMLPEPSRAGSEILYGVKAIAAQLGVTYRQALHLIETNKLPTFRLGRTVCVRRASLEQWLAHMEAQAKPGEATAGGDAHG